MSISDIIQIISIICASILSIFAIAISVLTLIQNNKIIFESNKPYISIFFGVINFTSPYPYLILKNFGKSGCTILNIEYDEILNTYLKREPLKSMQNAYIAPNQSYVYSLDYEKIDYYKTFNFKITYKYLGKIYTETHSASLKQYTDIAYTKHHFSKTSDDIKELSDILQEMIIQNI